MKWADIPMAAKMTTAAVVTIMSVVGYLSTFQTEAEAAEMEQRISKELKNIRIDEIENQIDLYEFQKLNEDLSQAKVEWLDKQIDKLEKKKDRLEQVEEKPDDA